MPTAVLIYSLEVALQLLTRTTAWLSAVRLSWRLTAVGLRAAVLRLLRLLLAIWCSVLSGWSLTVGLLSRVPQLLRSVARRSVCWLMVRQLALTSLVALLIVRGAVAARCAVVRHRGDAVCEVTQRREARRERSIEEEDAERRPVSESRGVRGRTERDFRAMSSMSSDLAVPVQLYISTRLPSCRQRGRDSEGGAALLLCGRAPAGGAHLLTDKRLRCG